MTTANEIIETLGLRPHPEGGHFREIHRDPAVTSIYFLLRAGERSHWHRVDATEIWNWHAGAPLTLSVSEDGVDIADHRLGEDLAAGQRPQAVVPAGAWQAAVTLGDWTLVGCAVAPAFDFAGFELAPPDWAPTSA
ncbi:MAG: cupin domain-containing protein [Alphaproteobacteria bacterium]|nr:cupin domain-containing protein [Alphaproteobacteria bacterium]